MYRVEAQIIAKTKFSVDLDRVLNEYARIAFTGMSRFVRIGPDGDLITDLSRCTPEDLDLLSEVTIDTFVDGRGEDARKVRRTKLKLFNRMNALEKLGKHLGLVDKKGDEAEDRFTAMIREITNGGASSMPIGTKPIPAPPPYDDEDIEP